MFTTAATCKQFELDLLNPGCAADSLEMRRTLVLILQNNIKVPPILFLELDLLHNPHVSIIRAYSFKQSNPARVSAQPLLNKYTIYHQYCILFYIDILYKCLT